MVRVRPSPSTDSTKLGLEVEMHHHLCSLNSLQQWHSPSLWRFRTINILKVLSLKCYRGKQNVVLARSCPA